MIDPKLNEVPADAAGDLEDQEQNASSKTRGAGAKRPRRGLSINDTVAADANLSVGSRGADFSGVESGAGAGAGMTSVTPGNAGSPAPNIVPGASGSGTTPRSDSGLRQNPTASTDADSGPTADEIAQRAYQCWHERGCPEGSPEIDWHRAEQELRERRGQHSQAAIA